MQKPRVGLARSVLINVHLEGEPNWSVILAFEPIDVIQNPNFQPLFANPEPIYMAI